MWRRLGLLVAVAAVVLFSAGSAWASGQQLCVGAPGKAVTTPVSAGTCAAGRSLITLATQSEVSTLQGEVAALKHKLSKITYVAKGLNGKPTVTVSGANLEIDSGSGATAGSVNGLGNLIIGYDENPGSQTGSNNLVLGNYQSFSSYGGIITGQHNILSGPFSDVFGEFNAANDPLSNILGGCGNITGTGGAGGLCSKNGLEAILGGSTNGASGRFASVSGGRANNANGDYASVSGGQSNSASGAWSSVSGGIDNSAQNVDSSVSGGHHNTASGAESSVSGGSGNTASGACQAIPSAPGSPC